VPGDCACLTRSPVQPASVALSAMIIRIRICCLPDQDDLYNRNSWWRASVSARKLPEREDLAALRVRSFGYLLTGIALRLKPREFHRRFSNLPPPRLFGS
jgi:hypothetical protein